MSILINVGYDSTNYYLLGQGSKRLLIDIGFPGTLPKFSAILRRKGIELRDIGYLLATHYHPDHAGAAQELKAHGVQLIVLEPQVPYIPKLKSILKPDMPYHDIDLHQTVRLTLDESRTFFSSIGFPGQVVSTPFHSEDCVTLVLDDGRAFTGDLHPPTMAEPGSPTMRCWESLRDLGATMIYPGHGPEWPINRWV